MNETDNTDLTKLPREELETYCKSLIKNALFLGELANKVQTENGKLRDEVKSLHNANDHLSAENGKLRDVACRVSKLSTGQGASAEQCSVVLAASDLLREIDG